MWQVRYGVDFCICIMHLVSAARETRPLCTAHAFNYATVLENTRWQPSVALLQVSEFVVCLTLGCCHSCLRPIAVHITLTPRRIQPPPQQGSHCAYPKAALPEHGRRALGV